MQETDYKNVKLCKSISESEIIVKIADNDSEMEQIHSLNHDTFVSELKQHSGDGQNRLVDSYNDFNIYFVAKIGEVVIGMICITKSNNNSFSVEKKMNDKSLINKFRDDALEIRLLAIKKEYRNAQVFRLLHKVIADYVLKMKKKYVLISGLKKNEKIYKRMGFIALSDAVQCGEALYIPMMLTAENYLRFRNSNKFVSKKDSYEPTH